MRGFREGAAYIAIKAGVDALPVGLEGTRQVLPMGSIMVKPAQVVLRIGEPIKAGGQNMHDRHSLNEELRRRVAELAGAAYRA
jgi:1-acyl-sn-glycerol-3-phosphate acyltransferase